jgi:lipoprotein-anchoring transpeptidase ErfK/SrfK
MRSAFAAVVIALAAATSAAAQSQAPSGTPTPTPVPTATPTVSPTITPAPTLVPTVTPVPTGRVVADGVTAGGIDLSGQTRAQAIASLQPLKTALAKNIVVTVADKTATLRMKRIKYALNIGKTVHRALKATEAKDIALANRYSKTEIHTFVDAFAQKVAVAPTDASIHITVHKIRTHPGVKGRALKGLATRKAIAAALNDPGAERTIAAPRKRVDPNIQRKELKDVYPTIITVDQSEFTARLYKNLHFFKSYPIAVGQPAYPTPNGLFSIQSKQVNPTWNVPNSPWAGELQGQSISGSDPSNPLKARWMGVTNGVGFHGTGEDYSIGTAASHGCMRMHVSDVIDLYDRVSIGTPVLIAP